MWHDWIIAGLGIWMIISGKIISGIYRLRKINYISAALVATVGSSWHCFFRSRRNELNLSTFGAFKSIVQGVLSCC